MTGYQKTLARPVEKVQSNYIIRILSRLRLELFSSSSRSVQGLLSNLSFQLKLQAFRKTSHIMCRSAYVSKMVVSVLLTVSLSSDGAGQCQSMLCSRSTFD